MKLNSRAVFPAICAIIILFFISDLFAQDTTSSLAFKNNRPGRRTTIFYQPDLSYPIWQQFKLIQEANSGDPLAMHELGLRYLFGEGFPADTVKAALWIGKAAEKKLAAAEYNYGILLNNGWGVDWNPFKAYEFFKDAASDGMPQAEYIYGILNTNNLIVKKNWDKAYTWVKKASDQGYLPAKEAAIELKKRVSPDYLDSTKSSSSEKNNTSSSANDEPTITSNLSLVFIDFASKSDSVPVITDKQIIEDIIRNSSESLIDTLGLNEKPDRSGGNDSSLIFKTTGISYLVKSAEAGNPEALTLIGRLYQEGVLFPKNIITASLYYLRATRLDSPTAPAILWYIIRQDGYFSKLKNLVEKNNADAMYVWYALYILGFDHQFTDNDAINLLQKAADEDHIPSIVELGLSYLTGKIVKQNKDKAISLWQRAEKTGSMEASIRIATAELLGEVNKGINISKDIQLLEKADTLGSVLSQVALAYCYEKGIGVKKFKADAVKYYRFAAQRGNRYAYDQLKRMYDEIRPPEFNIK